MAEYIVDQSRYTDMTMRYEIANGNKRIVRCRDCAKLGRCLWFRNWGYNLEGFCAWAEHKEK